MPKWKKDKKNQEGTKGTDKHKENPQTKPDEKEAAAPLSPVHQPPPPSDTPLEPSDDHDEEEDYDDGAGTGSAPRKKKREWTNPFKKKVKEKKQTSRKSSSGSIKSPVASPQGGSPLPIISKQMVIKELSSSYEVVPKDSEHEMKEFESEPSAKYSLHSSSVSNVPAFVESETTRKLVSVFMCACVCVCARISTYVLMLQGVWLASLAHSLLVHGFHLCIYCMEGYRLVHQSHSVAWVN